MEAVGKSSVSMIVDTKNVATTFNINEYETNATHYLTF